MKKKANKQKNVTVNINILSNIRLDGKSLIVLIVVLLILTLVVSISDSTLCAELIRALISILSDC